MVAIAIGVAGRGWGGLGNVYSTSHSLLKNLLSFRLYIKPFNRPTMPPRPWSSDYRVAVNVSKKLLKSKSNFQPVVEELVDLDEMFCSAVIVRNKGFIVWAKTWTECINRLVLFSVLWNMVVMDKIRSF